MSIEIPVICAIISSTCSLIWIANQICWYRIFKRHFEKQQQHSVLQQKILKLQFGHLLKEEESKKIK